VCPSATASMTERSGWASVGHWIDGSPPRRCRLLSDLANVVAQRVLVLDQVGGLVSNVCVVPSLH
jgi:hypothetical protein